MATHYYSGQGILYAGVRNASGGCDALQDIGNVPNLEISVEITKFEHKESLTGARATDLTVVQEKKGTFTLTVESISPKNLALAFWGTTSNPVAGSDATLAGIDRVVTLSGDKPGGATSNTMPADEVRLPIGPGIVNVDNVVVQDETNVTTYEFGPTPGDAGSLNGYIDQTNGTIVVFSANDQSTLGPAATITDGQNLRIASFDRVATDETMEAFTVNSQQRYLRFEGLNTIDDSPVIVDIYKADLDPLSGYGLINEELGSFEITGSILYDDLQPADQNFFRQVNVPVDQTP